MAVGQMTQSAVYSTRSSSIGEQMYTHIKKEEQEQNNVWGQVHKLSHSKSQILFWFIPLSAVKFAVIKTVSLPELWTTGRIITYFETLFAIR